MAGTGFENTSIFEYRGFNERDVPRSHMEGIDKTNLEGLHPSEKNLLIGENYYKQEIENSAGLRGAFEDISEHGSKEEFASYYEQYVDSPNELKEKSPEIYEFLRDRVFYGREYGLTGMAAFMNRTAPERTRGALEQTSLKEVNTVNESVLPRNQIRDSQILNCEMPYSFGNPEEMSEKMDTIHGDAGMLPIAGDRMLACRNLMALCGKKVSEAEAITYAVDNEVVDYDPLYMEGIHHGMNAHVLPRLIRDLSGIETEMMEKIPPAESIADKLDHGYRGLVVFNSDILNRSAEEADTFVGKIAENLLDRQANQAATLECAVRDGRTGEVKGFYIADSERNEPSRYVQADRLMKATDVKYASVLFTKKPYPEV